MATALALALALLLPTRAHADEPVDTVRRPTEKHWLRIAAGTLGLVVIGEAWYWRGGADTNADDRAFASASSALAAKATGEGFRWDGDGFVTNGLKHPLFGLSSYTLARENGLGVAGSLAFASLTSLAWETFGEIREYASYNDLLLTSPSGVPLGETLHLMLHERRGRTLREGAPVAGATVIVQSPDGSRLGMVAANAEGEYEVRDLAAGEIVLAAQSLTVGAFTQHPMTLAGGDNRADLELDLAGSIRGRVVDEGGHPIAGVHVHADCSGCTSDDFGDDTTMADGSFELKALRGGGVYTLHAFDIGTEEHPIPSAPGQAPIAVRDGNDHVKNVRFVVRRTR